MTDSDVPNAFEVEWVDTADGQEFTVSILPKQKEERKVADRPGADDVFERAFSAFTTSIIGYIELLPVAAVAYPVMSKDLLGEAKAFLENNCTSSVKSENKEVFNLSMAHYPQFRMVANAVMAVEHVGNQVPKMLLMGVISSFEYHISELIRCILAIRPQIVESSSKQLSLPEILQASSFDELRSRLTDEVVDDLMRQSFEEQIHWFEEKVKIAKISNNYERWSSLLEILERRNLFAHTNGFVSDIYIRNAKRGGFLADGVVKGEELFVRPRYLIDSIENVVLFLTMLIQVVWRKFSEDEGQEVADELLGNFAFSLIERGEYRLSVSVLEFARSLRGRKANRRKLMDLVNLANSYRLSKKEKEALSVLDSEDWSAVGDEFLTCVAAVRGDMAGCVAAMRRIGSAGVILAEHYEQWPVFFGVREDEEFKQTFREIFRRDFVPAPRHGKRIIGSLLRRERERQRAGVDARRKSTDTDAEQLFDDPRQLN